MVTIKDIAQEVGVSPSTVSRALRGSPLISTATKERVRAVAERLGYEPNELARALVKGASGAVGLLVPDITNPFFADIARGVGEVAHAAGYGVILCNTIGSIDREGSYISLLRRKQVDGLVLATATLNDPSTRRLSKTETPFILVSRICRGVDTSYVIGDDRVGARLAMEHLIELGHRRIGFIGGPSNVQSSRDRRSTYRKVLRQHGLSADDAWVCYADFTQAAGREAGKRILSLENRPTAIFAANDVTALGVLEAADELGLSVPEDLSLVGYDNIPYASLPRIQLTTVSQPTFKMGEIATEWLLSVLSDEDTPPLYRVLEPHLVVRSTTARPFSS